MYALVNWVIIGLGNDLVPKRWHPLVTKAIPLTNADSQ